MHMPSAFWGYSILSRITSNLGTQTIFLNWLRRWFPI